MFLLFLSLLLSESSLLLVWLKWKMFSKSFLNSKKLEEENFCYNLVKIHWLMNRNSIFFFRESMFSSTSGTGYFFAAFFLARNLMVNMFSATVSEILNKSFKTKKKRRSLFFCFLLCSRSFIPIRVEISFVLLPSLQ